MVSTTNLISYYKLDENAANTTVADAHGSNTGTASDNTSTLSIAGKINTALDFNGVDENVSMGDASDFNFGTSDFSIQAWVYMASATASEAIVCKTNGDAASTSYGWGLFFHTFGGLTNTVPQMIFATSTTHAQVIGNDTAFPTGQWVHIVAVVDRDTAANCKIYINGNSTGTTTANISTNTGSISNTANSKIASEGDNTGISFLDGAVDEIGIWNRALSAQDVADLYNSGSGLAYPFITTNSFTKDATARILIQDSFTKNSNARIQINDTGQVYDGKARIQINDTEFTKTGTSNILIPDNQFAKDANSRILIQNQFTKTGTARIFIEDNQFTKTGTARIAFEKSFTKTGNAYIITKSQFTKNGTASIQTEKSFTKTGNSSIQVNDNQFTKTGNACIRITSSFTKTANARIVFQNQFTKDANASISILDKFKPNVKIVESLKPRIKSIETFN